MGEKLCSSCGLWMIKEWPAQENPEKIKTKGIKNCTAENAKKTYLR